MAQEDPVLRSARREMVVSLAIFASALTYTVSYCRLYGFNRDPASLTFVFGFPDWIFHGVIVPWSVCVGLSWLFGAVFCRDQELGEEREERTDA